MASNIKGAKEEDKKVLLAHARLGAEHKEALENLSLMGIQYNETLAKLLKKPKAKRKQFDADSVMLTRYQPRIKGLLEDHLADDIDNSLFPFLKHPLPASRQERQTGSHIDNTLRVYKTQWHKKTKGQAVVKPPDGPAMLVFVLGGITWSEIRSAFEIAQQYNREVYIGSTHILTPESYLHDLQMLRKPIERPSPIIPPVQSGPATKATKPRKTVNPTQPPRSSSSGIANKVSKFNRFAKIFHLTHGQWSPLSLSLFLSLSSFPSAISLAPLSLSLSPLQPLFRHSYPSGNAVQTTTAIHPLLLDLATHYSKPAGSHGMQAQSMMRTESLPTPRHGQLEYEHAVPLDVWQRRCTAYTHAEPDWSMHHHGGRNSFSGESQRYGGNLMAVPVDVLPKPKTLGILPSDDTYRAAIDGEHSRNYDQRRRSQLFSLFEDPHNVHPNRQGSNRSSFDQAQPQQQQQQQQRSPDMPGSFNGLESYSLFYNSSYSRPRLSESVSDSVVTEQPTENSRGSETPITFLSQPVPNINVLVEFASFAVGAMWNSHASSLHSGHAEPLQRHGTSNVTPTFYNPTPAFKQFTLQILKATQLSSSVVFLALRYIYMLLTKHPGTWGTEGSEYRLFCAALILANKFLDDNTFTNSTWANLTGLPVKDINMMEMEFLTVLDFNICVQAEVFEHWSTVLMPYYDFIRNGTGWTSSAADKAAQAERLLKTLGAYYYYNSGKVDAKAHEAKGRVEATAHDVAGKTSATIDETKGKAKEVAHKATGQVKGKTESTAEQAKAKAEEAAEKAKAEAAKK
ncbi:hypothetical protein BZG36_03207 [Bifiguratus adelaidae]|uniref:Uncharacterized protein n=1 Tax=Bifiguratus adelaidae TaxID=1938954 RepID=A0A261Y197_9FUNG|nr:hypothetical protein BZG36_03207 [Bifiguratus adelaidae]